ncbi:MAG: hypothetical protein LBI69_03495 [Puniceicoccales bacterium]|jgi:hypothetical protein|nr:hypothetical protein [Puniceicoccales bacterium]
MKLRQFRFPFSLSGRIFWLVTAVLFLGNWIGCAFTHVWYRQKIFSVGREIRTIEAEATLLGRKNADLRAKIAQIHSPSILKSYALENFHEPSLNSYMRVSQEDIRGFQQRMAQSAEEIPAHGKKHLR